jgi:parallel beta-helix repeat protein
MNRLNISLGAVIAVITLASAWLVFGQGSLTPPGAPAPTMKTLDQIEPRTPITNLPYTISQPGSYYVTTNLTGVAGESGITIGADHVTLDLMGFELRGVPGSWNGITVGVGGRCITVRNGSIHSWQGAGIGGAVYDSRVENIRVAENGDRGISLAGGSFTEGGRNQVIGCYAITNGLGGSAVGIAAGEAALLRDCVAAANQGGGILVGSGSVLQNCVSVTNTANGFSLGTGTAIAQCTASSNAGHGFSGGGGLSIVNCSAQGNGYDGFLTEQATLVNCAASANGKNGIAVLSNSVVSACVAAGNQENGIQVIRNCQVLNNTCTGNANVSQRAGIRAEGDANRIDGNLAIGNLVDGIAVFSNATKNVVVRNTAQGNLGFQFRVPGIPGQLPAGANIVGPIVSDATNVNANAWANFSP